MDVKERLAESIFVVRAQLGDKLALERLIQRYHAPLKYYVRRMVRENSRADDVLQEIWLTVLRQLRKLARPEAFRSWLYGIARNKSLQAMRIVHRQHALPEEVPVNEDDETESDFSEEHAANLHTALGTLSIEHRDVLMLRFLEEMSYEEVAATTGCTAGTVKSRIYYAKRALRRALED